MTMLEKAARAAADADAKLCNGPSLYANNPTVYQAIARAVLLAVRVPESEIAEAGMIAGGFTGMADVAFTATIDAILAGEKVA